MSDVSKPAGSIDERGNTGLLQLQKIADLEADLFQANTTISALRATIRNQIEEIRALDELLTAAKAENERLASGEPAF